mgnify:CR=1
MTEECSARNLRRVRLLALRNGSENIMDEKRLEGAANSVAGKAEAAYGRLTGDAAAQAKGHARDAAGTVQRIYGQAKDAAENLGDAASDLASQAVETGGQYYRQSNRAVASVMRERPLGALLAAGAIGFGLALLLNRPAPRRRLRWGDLRDLRDWRELR